MTAWYRNRFKSPFMKFSYRSVPTSDFKTSEIPHWYQCSLTCIWFLKTFSTEYTYSNCVNRGTAELVAFYFPCGLLLAADKTNALPVGSKALEQQNSVCLGSTPPAEVFTSSLLFPFFQALFLLLHSLHPPFSFILYTCPIQNPETFLYLHSFFS